VIQTVLPGTLNYFLYGMSANWSPFPIMLMVSLIFTGCSLLQYYSSSKLKNIIVVWVFSAVALIMADMIGLWVFYLIFNDYNYIINILSGSVVVGSLLMLMYLPVIIWFKKKVLNRSE